MIIVKFQNSLQIEGAEADKVEALSSFVVAGESSRFCQRLTRAAAQTYT